MLRLILVFTLIAWGCGEDAVSSGTPNASDAGRSIGNETMEADSMVMVVDEQDPDVGMSEPTCREGERRGCEDSCGADLCVDGEFLGVCESASELCNGIDDDCDDAIDEDYQANGLGFSCQVIQENQCIGNGTNICSPSGTSVVCEAELVEPTDEVCDGRDNDCDDAIDEDFPGSLCCMETYQCPIGNVCTDGLCTKDEGSINPGGTGNSEECENSSDCPFGQYCESGSCVSAGGICISDDDCAAGYRCDDFICIPGSSGTACTYDFECETGEVCEDGRCSSDEDFCFVDADCPSGFECQSLVCVPEGSSSGNTEIDFCSDAIDLNNQTSTEDTTQGRSDSYRPSCAYGSSEAPDLIYRWVPRSSDRYTLDTNGSSFDTILTVLDGCGNTAVELECDDDDGDSTRSSITLEVDAFRTYYVVISGYFSTASGDTVLNITSENAMTPDCTLDSECNGNEVCLGGRCQTESGNGFCDATSSVTTGIETTGTTNTASELTRPSCGQSGSLSPDRVHRWTPTTTGNYTISTDGSEFDTILAVYEECDGGAADIECDDDDGAGSQSSITMDAQAFTTYYILVSGYKTEAAGNYTLNITGSGSVTPECTSSVQCEANQRCENERCVDNVQTSALCDRFRDGSVIGSEYPLTFGGSLTQNTVDNCSETEGPDYDLRWYPVQSGTYSIRVQSNSGAALILGVYEGCYDYSGRQVQCVNDWSALDYEETELTVNVDTIDEYELVISGQDSDDSGAFTLTITQD